MRTVTTAVTIASLLALAGCSAASPTVDAGSPGANASADSQVPTAVATDSPEPSVNYVALMDVPTCADLGVDDAKWDEAVSGLLVHGDDADLVAKVIEDTQYYCMQDMFVDLPVAEAMLNTGLVKDDIVVDPADLEFVFYYDPVRPTSGEEWCQTVLAATGFADFQASQGLAMGDVEAFVGTGDYGPAILCTIGPTQILSATGWSPSDAQTLLAGYAELDDAFGDRTEGFDALPIADGKGEYLADSTGTIGSLRGLVGTKVTSVDYGAPGVTVDKDVLARQLERMAMAALVTPLPAA